MQNIKWLALVLLLGGDSYYALEWATTIRSEPPGSFHSIPVDFSKPNPGQNLSSASDMNMARDELRKAALETANALAKQPCDPANVAPYVQAASNYARAWLQDAPCVIGDTCDRASRQIDRAHRDFDTPLDMRVKDAMMIAHKTGAVHAADFPPDVLPIMPTLASDPSLTPQSERALPSRFGRSKPRCGPDRIE